MAKQLRLIQQKVEQKVNSHHRQVVMEVYRNMVRSHNDLCGCNYCQVLKEYIDKKKSAHAIRRKMEDQDYPYFNDRTTTADYINILILNRQIEQLKQKKDSLKEI